MKAVALDSNAYQNSGLQVLDPRAKIVAFLLASLAIISVPVGHLGVFVPIYVLIGMLLFWSRVPLRYPLYRCLLASPFVLMAAALLQISVLVEVPPGAGQAASVPILVTLQIRSWHLGSSILLRAYGAVILLSLLTATCSLNQLLWGLHRLKAPKAFSLTAALMLRYVFILLEEWHRTTRARESRTPGTLRMSRLKVYGNQLAMIFLRSWERADRVQAAMVSRGFRGEFPAYHCGCFGAGDALFAAGIPLLFWGIRLIAAWQG
jgi:cobalt/nickel transport system permease protein